MMPFKWPKIRAPREETLNRINIPREAEGLTGIVQGERASAEEERLYQGFINAKIEPEDIVFQPTFITGVRNLPGEIRPDFLLYLGIMLIVYVDGGYWHDSKEQQNKDTIQAAILQAELEKNGQHGLIERVKGEQLQTQEDADAEARKLVWAT
jgi:hypothetical protein